MDDGTTSEMGSSEGRQIWGQRGCLFLAVLNMDPEWRFPGGHPMLGSGPGEGVWASAVDCLESGWTIQRVSAVRRPRPGTWETLTVRRHQQKTLGRRWDAGSCWGKAREEMVDGTVLVTIAL